MTNKNKYSRLLHIVTVFCFLLPFFYNGCGQSAAEKKKAEDKRIQDSIENAQRNVDSLLQVKSNTNFIQSDTLQNDTLQSDTLQNDTIKRQTQKILLDTADKKSEYISENLAKEYKFLRPILIPKDNIHTGLAAVIDTFRFINYFAIFVSLLLLIISLTIKFVDVDAKKAIGLLDTISLIFLAISQSTFFTSETLLGYWICLTALILLTIYDLYLIWLDKRLTNHK